MRHWFQRGAVMTATGLLALSPVAAVAAEGDPSGANGTVKIDGVDFADGPEVRNEPHVTCDLELEFFGFDEGQRADVVFSEEAPTGSEVVREDRQLLASDDPAGGAAPDPDATFRYEVLTAAPGDGDADGVRDIVLADDAQLQPQQGYHLRVDVVLFDADGAAVPGDGKHKVFWVEPCAQQSAIASESVGGAGGKAADRGGVAGRRMAGAGTSGAGTSGGEAAGVEAAGVAETGGPEASGDTRSESSGDTAVLGTKIGLSPLTAARARLASTGAGTVAIVGAAGALLLALGAALTVASRRRASRSR